jgi:hypothetical protein
MNRCKSKTFAKDSDFDKVYQFVMENVEFERKEYPSFDEPSPLKHKYIVTITAVDYKKDEV